jgi:hypothetical protein
MTPPSQTQLSLSFNQRWNHGRTTYRPPRETIRTADYEVAEIADDTTARDFVITHHYSRSVPAMRFRVGLYRHGALVGVAIFSHPCSDAVLTRTFPIPARSAVELGRFVLTDEEPGNAETYFLARAFELVRAHGIEGVVSFSDPMPRRDLAGTVTLVGHTGIIYQAFNGVYLGRGTARTLRLLPDGRAFNDRSIQKIRKTERGWRSAAAVLENLGAPHAPEEPEPRLNWLHSALSGFTRPVRHHGCHKYAWALTRPLKRTLPPSLPFPKFVDAAL